LFTVAALDYPFKGDIRIGPDAFKQVLGRFESSKLSDLRGRRSRSSRMTLSTCRSENSRGDIESGDLAPH
jgi:hypothetical protein